MKYIFLSILSTFLFLVGHGQSYSLQQLEASFLENNYALLASKFDISRAEAEVIQERVWPNPTIYIDQVNLWSNRTVDLLPRLIGEYGRKQQLVAGLEQLIETAGKRKKRVVIKQLEQKTSIYEFEELTRELKKELRQAYYRLASLSQEHQQLEAIVALFKQLNEQYERQVVLENVSRVDYHRVQSEYVSLRKEQVDLEDDIAEDLEKLRVLTQLEGLRLSQLVFDTQEQQRMKPLPADILELAMGQNIGIKRQATELEKAGTQLMLEKAQRKPDLTLMLGYDRGGNTMQDFIGVGVSVDLPVFNKNKGNIKAAEFQVKKEEAVQHALKWELESAVIRLNGQLQKYQHSLSDWPTDASMGRQDMLDGYKKHLQSGQVTLIEFIDFTQASRDAHKAYLDTWENYNITYEELQYLVGKDF
ncbi:TolC family protein [Sphingobacterium paludis]|uniref:Cobalt-zinc-cadmium efflux system outer membrane protein n=1 Tax=Sphingobacterium paludis TaxID=1476465 RepID=A0A4R7DB69_9SPHI|nr:TolC family protein [Sphingobacterium paludis]TDS17375.1 cobalt-zinc-cadmium efflux system outer membrane protein [Sphingobacterium paludis]